MYKLKGFVPQLHNFSVHLRHVLHLNQKNLFYVAIKSKWPDAETFCSKVENLEITWKTGNIV